jgi:CheY-specific phosphatase CheX
MPTASLQPHLLEGLRECARHVLATVAPARALTVTAEPEPEASFTDAMIGLLGFTGTLSGTFVVRAGEQVARELCARMLMLDAASTLTDADACDAFGELVNMLAGEFKNRWVAAGNRMELCVPNVIHHGRVRLRDYADRALRSRVRVQLETGALDVGVHFEARIERRAGRP